MTSLTGADTNKDLKQLMQQIIDERDAKFAPTQKGDEVAPTGSMFNKPEVKSEEGDAIIDLLGYLEQKRAKALESYQSKVMRRSSKPLPKPEDVDVSSFLSEAGLSPTSVADPLTILSSQAPELGKPSAKFASDNFIMDPSKEPAKPMLSGEQATRESLPVEELTSVSPTPVDAPSIDPVDFKVPEYKVYSSPDEMSELEILARTIEAEAALESYKGKIAVGATIANRASSGSYGKDIRGVILKPAQFSPWNRYTGGAKGKQGINMMELRASEDSYKAAKAILTGNYDDPTNGATHYVNESIAEGQQWIAIMKGRKKGTVTIGNHLFGNADSNKNYDGKSYIFDRKSETTDQPVEAAPTTVKAIQRIIGTAVDGVFGAASRKKAREFLSNKGIGITKSATDEDLMKLVVSS